MRRALMSCVIVVVAVVVQLTVLNRLPLPGGAPPDLVLLAVVALALTGGSMQGMVLGFAAGLALDIAPPASHVIGQYALVLCLVGYLCGKLAGELDRSVWFPLAAVAGGAVGGAALYAAVGMILGDPRITWPAMRHVLPPSVIYDVLLSPFVLYGMMRAARWVTGAARGRDGALPVGQLAGQARAIGQARAPGVAPSGTPVAAPRLRLSAQRQPDGWIGGARLPAWRHAASQAQRERPGQLASHGRGGHGRGGLRSLRFGGDRHGRPPHRAGQGHGIAGSPARGGPRSSGGQARVRFGARRGDGVFGGGSLIGRQGGAGRTGAGRTGAGRSGSGRGASPRFRRKLGATQLGGSSFSGSSLGGKSLSGKSLGGRRSAIARLRRGRSTVWRIGGKRTGGY
jgi:rod shape-determining protein MreD